MANTFTKTGIGFEDHHMKDAEGRYQSSPPKNLKTLYDFLPSERDTAAKLTPQKVVIKCAINALKVQGHCCGVYTLIHGKQHNDRPMWKHSSEDLTLCLSKVGGDSCWVVAHSKTLETKERLCMKASAAGDRTFPFGSAYKWSEWDGRDWREAPSLSARPSHHGWGADSGDGWQFPSETSYHEQQFALHKATAH